MSEIQWYYSKNNKQHGPVSTKELQQLESSGEITPTDLVWYKGMPNWLPLHEALTQEPPTQPEPTSATGAASRKGIWKKAQELAQDVGRATTSTVQEESQDDFAEFGGGMDQPAVFLRPRYFGGRSRIGIPPSRMTTPVFLISGTILGWTFILIYLWISRAAWQFLPFSRTEFLRINLRQSIRWAKVCLVFFIWLGCSFLTVLVALFFAQADISIGALVALAGALASNFVASKLLAGLGEKLFRSQIDLEYGFPHKYRLLCGYSDAPIGAQIDGVLKLCEAIADSEFSNWEQLSTHGSQGLLGAVYGRVTNLLRS